MTPAIAEVTADLARCPLCGGWAESAFTVGDRNRELTDEAFRYRRCTACGTLSLVDVPDDLSRYYPSEYYELPEAGELAGLMRLEEHKVAMIADRVAPGRLVEIGPGPGVFAHGASAAGFEVTAIEMDERTCTHLRDVIGVRALTSADPAVALGTLPPSRAIAMWHVIEHLADPWEVLEAAAANLEAGGVLAVSTPNPRAMQIRVLGTRWAHIDAPRHLFLIPLDTLVERAAGAGLRCVDRTTSDLTGRACNRLGWEYGLRRRPAGPPTPVLSQVARGLTAALSPIENTGLRGAAYTAIFVKEPGAGRDSRGRRAGSHG